MTPGQSKLLQSCLWAALFGWLAGKLMEGRRK